MFLTALSSVVSAGFLLLVVVSVPALTAGANRSTGGQAEPLPPDAGRQLYLRDCGWCHGPQGQGSRAGPPLTDAGAAAAHFMVSTGRMPIDDPDERPRRGKPGYSEAEIDAIVTTVASFGSGPDIPAVDPSSGDIGRGGELYRLHCAPCHSATGIGGALPYGAYAEPVLEATPTQVAEAMLVGPAAMPRFPAFSPDELNAIVRYVAYLRQPATPGGAALGRSGRVEEGLVAWGVGLAGLVLAVRWIARRA